MERNETFVDRLHAVEEQMNRCLIIPLILGLMGNGSSCIVFGQRQFRSNGVSLLFRAASACSIVVLMYGIGTSLYLMDHENADGYSIVFCKVHLYIRHILLMTVRTYIVFACIASFALSSPRATFRSLCQARYVKWTIFLIPLVWPLLALHIPLLKEIRSNRCVNMDFYVLPFGIYYFLVVGVLPILSMLLFILLTIQNLRSLHRRIQPSVVTPIKLKSRDQQFIRMLSALVLMYTITNLFYPVNVLYSSITFYVDKSEERIAIESLIFSLTSNYVVYINNVSPFFLFVFSSTAFRRSFDAVLRKYTPFLFCKTSTRERLPTTLPLTAQNRL